MHRWSPTGVDVVSLIVVFGKNGTGCVSATLGSACEPSSVRSIGGICPANMGRRALITIMAVASATSGVAGWRDRALIGEHEVSRRRSSASVSRRAPAGRRSGVQNVFLH